LQDGSIVLSVTQWASRVLGYAHGTDSSHYDGSEVEVEDREYTRILLVDTWKGSNPASIQAILEKSSARGVSWHKDGIDQTWYDFAYPGII
jgi:hypothetical protein